MDSYLSLYVSQEEHRNNHLQSKPTLTPQEKTFISSHLSSTPNIIASKMMSMDMIDSSQHSPSSNSISPPIKQCKTKFRISITSTTTKLPWCLKPIKC